MSDSSLDWTIVRPPGLTDNPGTGYAVAEDWMDGGYCARDDLATMLLDQLDDCRRYLRHPRSKGHRRDPGREPGASN